MNNTNNLSFVDCTFCQKKICLQIKACRSCELLEFENEFLKQENKKNE